MTTLRDDVPTLVAVGAAVSVVAALAHEALGHGSGCLADGGTVTLITYLVFRCAGAGVLADGGGPIGAFVVAALCLLAVHRWRGRRGVAGLFLFALGAQTLFWVFAQMMREAIDGSDDWGHVARDLHWNAVWPVVVGAIGAAGYGATIRIAARLGRPIAAGRPQRLLVPWVAAAASATLLGALWHGARAASALDAFLSFGVAPIGYWLSIAVIAREPPAASGGAVRLGAGWLAGVALLWLLYAATIARGLGTLA